MYYTVFIREKPLILMPSSFVTSAMYVPSDVQFTGKYTGQRSSLYEYIEMLEQGTEWSGIVVHAEDLNKLWKDFQSLYRIVTAAGGIVYEPEGHVLMIYRLKHWDLPKGKIDAHESSEEAAVREVMEETGLENVEIKTHFGETYHTYMEGKNRILKKTIWYTMFSKDKELSLQTEEHIEAAVWVDVSDFLSQNPKPIYASIKHLLRQLLNH